MGTQPKLEKMLLPVVPCPLLTSSDAYKILYPINTIVRQKNVLTWEEIGGEDLKNIIASRTSVSAFMTPCKLSSVTLG